MSDLKVFEHAGVKFFVLNERPDPRLLQSGDWVRICYEPNSSKSDIVALVIARHLTWPLNHNSAPDAPAFLPDDYLLELARNGDHTDTFKQFFSQEYIELVARMDDQSRPRDGGRLGRQS